MQYYNARNQKKRIHCGKLILGKISKIGATRCQILTPKCTKFDFRWVAAPDPTGELTALCASARPSIAVFYGHTSKGMNGGREGEGKR